MFPKSVLEQAQFDAEIARQNNPDRNIFQRSQDFLRNKLSGGKPVAPSARTPQQQTNYDMREAQRISRELQKGKNVKNLRGLMPKTPGITGSLGTLTTGLAIGAGIGQYMKDNLDINTAGSGRGSGRAAFNPPNEQEKPVYGQLPPSVNTNLAAYDESVTLPGMSGQLPDDYKDTEQRAGRTAEDYRSGAGFGSQQLDRTVTSPNTGNMPMNWAQYEVFLANKGIELANTKKQTSGFESVNLPAGSEPITSTKVFQQDGIEFDSLYGGKLRQGDMTTPELKGLGTGMAENYRPGTYGLDPQSGASPLPDASDQSRALEVDQTKNRALPRGARQREKFLAQNPNYGQPAAPKTEKGTGISARGRAFLDAPMGAGPLELMQRTNAAQNILRKDGKIAIKDSEGDYNEISQEGYDKIRGDMRNQTEFGQEFLSQYLTTPAKPADAQSPSSIEPKPATKDLSQLNEAYQSPIYPNMLQNYSEDTPDMGLDPKIFELGIIGKRK